MAALYILILLLPLPVLLNRWRGTGDIFKIFGFAATGNILYAVYIALVIGLLSTWYYGLIAGALYILGESMGWGKWVGYLTADNQIENYNDKDGQKVEKTEWHNIVAHNKLAEISEKYLTKGSLVSISGKLATRNYEKEGVKHFVTEIIASKIEFLDSKKSEEEAK